MSNQPQHPGEAALARLADGQLDRSEALAIEQHLEACPACRSEVEDLRAAVEDCVRYRREVLQPLLPPPPSEWADLRAEMARLDRTELETAERRWWRAPVLRWGLIPAAAALALAIFYQLRETPSVQAATLLRKAEAAAAARPAPRRHLLIRSRMGQITRLAGVAGTLPQEPAAPALEALFQQAHWDWNDPLSARAFAAWRDPLPEKTDIVTSTAGTVEVRTLTPGGPLAAASLTFGNDLLPRSGRLEFRNQDWVEMSEVPEVASQSDGTPTAPRPGEPAARPAETPAPALAAPETALFSSELHALLKLHEIKADLGDPVDVSTSGGHVVVTGHVGVAPERQRQIEAAMQGIPNVTVHFSDTEPTPATSEPPSATGAPQTGAAGAIAARVERQLGGKPQFERFSTQMLDWTEAASAQAYALRRLAEHFPPEREASLEAADRRALRATAREEAAALEAVTRKMARTVEPVAMALGGENAGAGPAPTSWQSAAEDLLQAARRADHNLSIMLGATRGGDASFSASDLLRDLSRIVTDSAACQRLLGPE